jgi:hypothetical protein
MWRMVIMKRIVLCFSILFIGLYCSQITESVHKTNDQDKAGSIVGWGDRVVVGSGDLKDLVAIECGWKHNLGLKSDGSIVAWGWNRFGQCNVPKPKAGFEAIAGGRYHSLAIRR